MECIVYAVKCTKNDRAIYIGSSIYSNKYVRYGNHIQLYGKWKLGKVKRIGLYDMFDKYGVENCFIDVLEHLYIDKGTPNMTTKEIKEINKKELRRYEGIYQRMYKDNPYYECVNVKTEVYGDSKSKKYQQKYYETHKEEIKKYRESHKEERKKYQQEYRETHKEEIKICRKKYYDDNKENIYIKQSEKIECPICGSIVSKKHLARHKRTIKCKTFNKGTE